MGHVVNKYSIILSKVILELSSIKCLRLIINYHAYREGISHDLPEIIDEERSKRTLLMLHWIYTSKNVFIQEAKKQDEKDLLAIIGGLLGIFVGYSMFDFSQHIIDGVHFFIKNPEKILKWFNPFAIAKKVAPHTEVGN